MATSSRPTDALAGMWEGVHAVPPMQHGILTKTRLADWELLRGLGEGEFAKVQSCRRAGDPTIYACKHIIKARLVCASNIKRTLRRVRRVGTEITAMKKLRHKCVNVRGVMRRRDNTCLAHRLARVSTHRLFSARRRVVEMRRALLSTRPCA